MKVFRGTVISDKMARTVVVTVTRFMAHPLYHKRMRKTSKFHADNLMKAKTGDVVEITEIKPMSRTKFHKVTKIITPHVAA